MHSERDGRQNNGSQRGGGRARPDKQPPTPACREQTRLNPKTSRFHRTDGYKVAPANTGPNWAPCWRWWSRCHRPGGWNWWFRAGFRADFSGLLPGRFDRQAPHKKTTKPPGHFQRNSAERGVTWRRGCQPGGGFNRIAGLTGAESENKVSPG